MAVGELQAMLMPWGTQAAAELVGQPRATFMSPLPISGPFTEWFAGLRDGWLRQTALCLETISSALKPIEAPNLSPATSPTGD
jgi:hypothetical protein